MPKNAVIRLRLSHKDAHYAGGLVSSGRLMEIFADVATELCIAKDGVEGLFRAYEDIEFLAPVRAGDFVEAHGKIIKVGNSSRKMEFRMYKVIAASTDPDESTKARLLKKPILVARAIGTCVVL